jgi:protein O-GlcNAc transferase
MESIRQSIALNPNHAPAHCNLGEAYRATGRLDEAVAAFRRALQIKPDYPEAHNNLGTALAAQDRLDEAIAAFRCALRLKPGYPEAHKNLGIALRRQGHLDEAVAEHRRALQFKPDYPEALNNLSIALRERGDLDDAIAACRRALELKPDYAEAHVNLGVGLTRLGQFGQAFAALRRALELKPHSPEAHNNLGNALKDHRDFDEAIAAFHEAIQLKPDSPEAHDNLGNILRDLAEFDDSIAAFRRALRIKPDDPAVHSHLIFALHLHPGHDAGMISEEHQRWNRQFGDPLKQVVRPHANDSDPNRLLRVGYVSPDFREHPVGRYALPLFERHDRERFEILCYSGVLQPDWMTERFRALAGSWRNTIGVSDTRLAAMILDDEVDILVDLALHTPGNRLPMFARRPAPVQVSWLGYPGGTGLPGIGYRLTDAHMDPPGEGPAWSAEEPVRLPDCWCCYQPAGDSPEINALPALSAERVTFGSLNNFAKVNEQVLALWARVLKAVIGSRLLIFCPEGGTRDRVRAFFGARGIGAERLELVGFLPRWEYLRLYQRIDLAVDPFPFNGMTTTCDALWMGVPVLTLPGKMPASRAALSLLSTVALPEFAASSEDDYVRLAAEIAADLPRLADLRATLRRRMQSSPLMDAPRFARNIEAAYRSLWKRWRPEQSTMRNP